MVRLHRLSHSVPVRPQPVDQIDPIVGSPRENGEHYARAGSALKPTSEISRQPMT